MKRIWIGLVALAVTGAVAQQQQGAQSGTPALLEAFNGKQARVFLQDLKDGKLTFQAYKSNRNITVPAEKVKSLTFYPKYDAAAVEQQFSAGDYAAVVSSLDPLMEPYWEYMVVDNNLHGAFCMLMEAQRKGGNLSKVREAAALLVGSGDPVLVQRGQVNIALAAITDNDLETARKLRGEATSEAAGLYMQACIERAEQRPKDAIKTVSNIIIDHANDIEWLAPSELLCAHLYMDMMEMMGTNSVITTNSALHTARQVKNIYAGTSAAADAEKLWVSLGGAELEAAIAAKKAAREAEEKAAREKREAEEKAVQEKEEAEEKDRLEAAAAADAASTNNVEAGQVEDMASTNDVNTTTEMESEKENGGK